MAQTMMTTGGDTQAQWARVRGRLRDEFGEAAFRSWLKSMTLAEVSDGRVRIGVPTRFLRDWVAAHYADRIRALWNGENGAIAAIDIFVNGGGTPIAEWRRRRSSARRSRRTAACATTHRAMAPSRSARTRTSARRSTRASPSRISSSASRTSWRMRRRAASPKPGRPSALGAVQPAVPLWRRRARQDASDACHRLAHPHA